MCRYGGEHTSAAKAALRWEVYGMSKDVPLTKRGFAQGPVEMTAFVGVGGERRVRT